jgi:hypothetical protein
MANLRDEFQWYLDHQEDLVQKFNGRTIVIKDQEVVGVYDTDKEAYDDATKKFEIGTFLIQKCTPGERDYSQTFHSRAIFM